jgi:hypothetical protein
LGGLLGGLLDLLEGVFLLLEVLAQEGDHGAKRAERPLEVLDLTACLVGVVGELLLQVAAVSLVLKLCSILSTVFSIFSAAPSLNSTRSRGDSIRSSTRLLALWKISLMSFLSKAVTSGVRSPVGPVKPSSRTIQARALSLSSAARYD